MKDSRKVFPVLSLLLLLLLVFGSTASVWAQSLVSGDVTGTITDPSGAVLPNVQVTLKSNSTGATRTTTTNQSGFYRFALLQPGVYTVLASPQGFQEVTKVVNVATGQATSANLQAKLAGSTTTVQVTAETPVVQADTSEISTSYDQRQVSLLPNPGNDLTAMVNATPGITPNTASGGFGYGNFSSFGLPGTSNLFTINGENNMDPYFNINNSGATNLTLGKNDVQEATVVNNPYSGQYGQQAGAQVNYVTKSGSNEVHGNLEYWWNGRVLNAADWFSNNAPDTAHQDQRPFANNNQWAASIGGPLKKNSTFFFLNTEGLRFVLPVVQQVYLPTQAFASAVLANPAINALGELPAYKKLFETMLAAPGAASAAPVAGSCGSDIRTAYVGPGSTTPGLVGGTCVNHYTSGVNSPSNEWILSGRLDQNIGSSTRLFGRYRQDKGVQATYTDAFTPQLNATSKQPSYDGQLQLTTTLGGRSTNQFIAAGSYYRAIFSQDTATALSVTPVDFIFQGGIQLGSLQSGNYRFGDTSSFPQGRNVTQYQFIDDYSMSVGNHDLKIGMNYRRYDISDFNYSILENPRVYISSLADFANGLGDRYRQRFSAAPVQPVALWGLGIYGQDEWRASKNLRLTLALRAEHNSNPVCNRNCISRLAGPFNTLTHDTTGDLPYNSAIQSGLKQAYPGTDSINWGPRFGFAWSPMGNQKTVLRGGFGIFYDSLPSSLMENFMFNAPGQTEFNYRHTLTNGIPALPWVPGVPGGAGLVVTGSNTTFQNGFANNATLNSLSGPGSLFTPPSFQNAAGTLHTPRYQEWNIELQQALGTKSAISINYVGNHGIHIPIVNVGVNASDSTGVFTSLPTSTPDVRFSDVTELYTAAVSNSNGVTVSFQRKFGAGFSMQASYTWAHALDEVSNGGVNPYSLADSDQWQFNPFSLRSNYGNADYDVRHTFNANYVWEVPFKFGNAFVNQVVGGWTFSGNFFTRSGLPYTVEDSNIIPDGYDAGAAFPYAQMLSGVKPQLGCNDPGSDALHNCLNFAAFGDPTNFTGQRRNQFRGPKFFDTDLSITKNFKIRERVAIGVGASIFNILNHPNFATPQHDYALCSGAVVDPVTGDVTPTPGAPCTGSGFGQIVQTVGVPTSPYGSFVGAGANGRLIQLHAKLTF